MSLLFMVGAGRKEPILLDQIILDWAGRVFPESSYSFFNGAAQLGDKTLIGIFVLFMIMWFVIQKRDFLGLLYCFWLLH